MKWKYLPLFFLTFSFLLSNVAALRLIVQSETIAGAPSLVVWTREASDPADLNFDLRFVQDEFTDVGLAVANVTPDASQSFGTISVNFPKAGNYVLIAVTGSLRDDQIGTSNETEAIDVTSSTVISSTAATSTTAPSSTSGSSPTSTTLTPTPPPSVTPQPSTSIAPLPVSSTSRKVNLPAIVGGLIGALIFLGLLAALIVYISRRKSHIARRFTFHKDMMVQRRISDRPAPATGIASIITPYPFSRTSQRLSSGPTSPSTTIRTDADVEQGLAPPASAPPSAVQALGNAPLGTGHIVPSPRGPRPSLKRERNAGSKPSTTPTTAKTSIIPTVPQSVPPLTPSPPTPPTRRQKEIASRIAQLNTQMTELQRQSRPDATVSTVLGDMQRQMVWLREQENGPWALGQTDILPPGFARYMTP